MPSKVRIVVRDENRIVHVGAEALQWLRNRCPLSAAGPLNVTSEWKRLVRSYRVMPPPGTILQLFRERKNCRLRHSIYRATLIQYGRYPSRQPRAVNLAIPPRPPSVPASALYSPWYGWQFYHWVWRTEGRPDDIPVIARAALSAGNRTFNDPTRLGVIQQVSDYIAILRRWTPPPQSPQRRFSVARLQLDSDTSQPNRQEERFRPQFPAPRIGIWR